MKKTMVGFAILLLSILLGYLIKQDPGYLLIYYQQWSVATSLWVGLLILFLLFTLFYVFIQLIKNTFSLPKQLSRWYKQSQQKKSWTLTNEGICHLIQQEWRQSEKTALKASRNNANPLIDYISAAYAAHKQGEHDRAQQYLAKAISINKHAYPAITALQIQLLISRGQLEQAKSLALSLQSKTPSAKIALKLLTDINQQLNQWEDIKLNIPLLRKYKTLPSQQIDALEKKAFFHLMQAAAENNEASSLNAHWKELPRSCQKDAMLAVTYAKGLIKTQQTDKALEFITQRLKKQWIAQLMGLLPHIKTDNPAQQLLIAEKWHEKHPQDLDLLQALAQLSVQAGFMAKAEDFLMQALNIQASSTIHALLGDFYTHQIDHEKALTHYKKALLITAQNT